MVLDTSSLLVRENMLRIFIMVVNDIISDGHKNTNKNPHSSLPSRIHLSSSCSESLLESDVDWWLFGVSMVPIGQNKFVWCTDEDFLARKSVWMYFCRFQLLQISATKLTIIRPHELLTAWYCRLL